MENYHEDLNKLSIYDINNNSLDIEKCSITEDEYGFINVKFVFKDKSFDTADKDGNPINFLQDATATRREVIAKKAKYGGMVLECSADNVVFNKLEVTFKLWKSGNIRSVTVYEDYDMTAKTIIGNQTQECKFNSNFYYSNDPEELPIGEFEFKKP